MHYLPTGLFSTGPSTALAAASPSGSIPAPRTVSFKLKLPVQGGALDVDARVDDNSARPAGAKVANPTAREASSAMPPPTAQAAPDSARLERRDITVKRGDSLYTIFESLSLNQGQLIALTKGGGKALKRLHPGQVLEFYVDPDNALERLVYRPDAVRSIRFTRTASGYDLERIEEPYDRRQANARGSIHSSLFLDGQRAGLSDKVIMEMVEIFGWDVDFALDIRAGDRFSVIYEELFKDGNKVRDGEILAAEFINRGRTIRALRYTDPDARTAYFSPDGDSMRKAFLRTPVKFSRISSRFNSGRLHPVLHTIRAHRGVDYAAPRGTPVKATGDGKVVFAGRKGGYGKTVIIRHGGTYTTLYAHLSRIAKRARAGRSVQQGELIGYVGSTGLATGSHLHYEFRVRGVHRNPLKVKLPKAAPIAARYKAAFKRQTRAALAMLDSLSQTQVAANP